MERLKGDIFMATLKEISDYLMEQGVVQAEINEIIDFYALRSDGFFDPDEWKVNFIVDADEWLEEQINSRDIASYGKGDFIDYIKKEFLSDTAKVMYGFADYLMDNKDDEYVVYCKDTNRLIFFEA